jgi:hypothetical protein
MEQWIVENYPAILLARKQQSESSDKSEDL